MVYTKFISIFNRLTQFMKQLFPIRCARC